MNNKIIKNFTYDVDIDKEEIKNNLDVDKLLKALENEKNESLINFNTKKIRELNYNILKELELPTEVLIDYMNKLEGYKYVDEMNELRYGTFIRWIPISNPEKIELKKGGILVDVKIGNRGVNLTCRGLGYFKNYVTFLMDECLIFQKLSEQEKILLLALDQLEK